MEIIEKNELIIIKGVLDFNLEQIVDSGQAFRFYKMGEGYVLVAFGRVIEIKKINDDIIIENSSLEDVSNIWVDYFDLKRDYGEIKNVFLKDSVMISAIEYGSGIRMLAQDKWEMLITFIISQQNNIPRIKSIVNALCTNFGEKVEYKGQNYYTFPTPKRIAELTLQDLAVLKCGYRASYILESAKKVVSGEFDLSAIDDMDIIEARKALLTLKGVGIKVADCVLLFGYKKFNAFPVDVWMDRVIGVLYDRETFNPEIFGEYCGIAQQYLFYYAKGTKIGKK